MKLCFIMRRHLGNLSIDEAFQRVLGSVVGRRLG